MSTTNSSSTTTNSSTTISSQQSLISAFFMNVASPDNTINRCLSERDLLISANGLERFVLGYLFPPLILFGVTGNALNLTVLMAPRMKTRPNILLATLAVADMLFLLLMLPNTVANYRVFEMNNYFRLFYLTTKIHFLALINWASSTAIWIVLTVSLERLLAIKYPLRARKHGGCRTSWMIAVILVGTGALNFYNLMSYTCITRYFCNHTQIYSFCFAGDAEKWAFHGTQERPNPHSLIRRLYVLWSPHIHAIFVVFIPTIVIIVANVMLLWTVHQRQKYFIDTTAARPSVHSSSSITRPPNHPKSPKNSKKRSSAASQNGSVAMAAAALSSSLRGRELQQQQQHYGGGVGGANSGGGASSMNPQLLVEQKVTITVSAIVTCFTITQTPSAIVMLATGFAPKGTQLVQLLRTLTYALVVLGKSLNFVLFCLSSSTFRARLQKILKARLFGGGRARSPNTFSTCDSSKKGGGGGGYKKRSEGMMMELTVPPGHLHYAASGGGESAKLLLMHK